jgi:hypothetical protein
MAKQKSLKKTIKSNKKKKLNLKNIDFKKNWKKLSFGGALALLLFSSISFAGYTYIEQRNVEAKAAGWTLVHASSPARLTIRACRYGSTNNVRLQYGNALFGSYNFFANGQNTTVSGSNNIYYPKYVYKTIYSSPNGLNVGISGKGSTTFNIYGVALC